MPRCSGYTSKQVRCKVACKIGHATCRHHIDQQITCAVCLNNIPTNNKRTTLLSCGHSFCRVCISSWIHKNKTTCPLCRNEINKDEIDKMMQSKVHSVVESWDETPIAQLGRSFRVHTGLSAGIHELMRAHIQEAFQAHFDSLAIG